MAGKNTKTAAEAAAQGGASAPPASEPGTEQQSQSAAGATGGTEGGGDEKGEEPDYRAKYEEARAQVQQLTTELEAVTSQRDEARHYGTTVNEQLQDTLRQLHAATNPDADAQPADATGTDDEQPIGEARPYDEAAIRDLLTRNGLAKAWVMPDGSISFDPKHVAHFMGEEGVDSLTSISAE